MRSVRRYLRGVSDCNRWFGGVAYSQEMQRQLQTKVEVLESFINERSISQAASPRFHRPITTIMCMLQCTAGRKDWVYSNPLP
eukprot:scaffold389749_cov21-Prasinocladus_malaysianus.AAC.1